MNTKKIAVYDSKLVYTKGFERDRHHQREIWKAKDRKFKPFDK